MKAKLLTIDRAASIGGQTPPVLRIVIEQEIQDFRDLSDFRAAGDYYALQARQLEECLNESLPGGTYDQLFAHMAARKASLFRVPYGKAQDCAPDVQAAMEKADL